MNPYFNQLGDKVEKALEPIVKVIDDKLGTNIKGCSGCQKRKQWLNQLTQPKEPIEEEPPFDNR